VKKIVVTSFILVMIMVIPSLSGANTANTITSIPDRNNEPINTSYEEFTHTVFVEYATATTCPYCVVASSQLYSIYESNDYNFYYVSLVADKNAKAYRRVKNLGVTGVPDVYFDGKYTHIVGAQSDEQPYRNAIINAGTREVPNIDIHVDVSWIAKAVLKIRITVQNNESEEYNGQIRAYIVEPISRWNDRDGNPYHFGVLDIPLDRSLSLPYNNNAYPHPLDGRSDSTYEFTRIWIGALHGFGDITKDNIMVIAAVFDKNNDQAIASSAATPNSENTHNSVFKIIQEIRNIIELTLSTIKTEKHLPSILYR